MLSVDGKFGLSLAFQDDFNTGGRSSNKACIQGLLSYFIHFLHVNCFNEVSIFSVTNKKMGNFDTS